MITENKVHEYIRFNGDIDGWVRSDADKKGIITEDEWYFIDAMLSEIAIVRKGFASTAFKDAHERKIRDQFDCEATYRLLATHENRSEPAH